MPFPSLSVSCGTFLERLKREAQSIHSDTRNFTFLRENDRHEECKVSERLLWNSTGPRCQLLWSSAQCYWVILNVSRLANNPAPSKPCVRSWNLKSGLVRPGYFWAATGTHNVVTISCTFICRLKGRMILEHCSPNVPFATHSCIVSASTKWEGIT